jgi:hypothetical protein
LKSAFRRDVFPCAQQSASQQWRNVMKKILVLAALATALASAPAFARGGHGGHSIGGLNVGANVLTGKGGVLGLLDGRSALVTNVAVTTGKGGVLGAVLGKGHLLGGLLGGHGGGCGCY